MKDEAAAHLEQPPLQLLRIALTRAQPGALSQLLNQGALTKKVLRVRLANVPLNPKSLSSFEELPLRYQ